MSYPPPPRPPRFLGNPYTRARLALWGTITLCAYTTFRSYATRSLLADATRTQDNVRLQSGLKENDSIRKHFVCSRKNLTDGRWYTLITSTWNHASGVHFLGNMLGLWSFGRVIAYNFGARAFLAVFYGGGVVGNLACLGLDKRASVVGGNGQEQEGAKKESAKDAWSSLRQRLRLRNQKLLRREEEQEVVDHPQPEFVGASGGICALTAAMACLNPWGTMIIGIMFVPVPVPNVLGCLGFAGFSAWAQRSDFQGDVAHLGHLGGLVYGLLWVLARFRGFPRLTWHY